ncbi:hypothetical protein KCU81_g791, partial [Aureobasidium melanogenum]
MHNLEAERIHPVFRKDMFRNITDAGYKLMLPSILLASAWLKETNADLIDQEYEKMLEDTLDLAGVPESHKFGDFDLN